MHSVPASRPSRCTRRGNAYDIRHPCHAYVSNRSRLRRTFSLRPHARTGIRFLTEPENDPVGHEHFISLYDRSANVEGFSPFNKPLCIGRHFEDSILSIRGGKKIKVEQDGSVTSVDVDDALARQALVEEFGISEEAAYALPRDEPDTPSFHTPTVQR